MGYFEINERVLFKCAGCGWSSATVIDIDNSEGESIYNVAHDGHEFPSTKGTALRKHPKTSDVLYHQEIN